jgi:hypothetical protein
MIVHRRQVLTIRLVARRESPYAAAKNIFLQTKDGIEEDR